MCLPARCSACFVGLLLSLPLYGRRCRVSGVCVVCLARTDVPASRARVVRHPFVPTRTDGPASRARAVRHPVFLFRRCRRPAARVLLLALPFLVSARLLALLCCLAPPAAAPPPLPHPIPPLAVFPPPLAAWCRRACRRLLPPPPSPRGCRFAAVSVSVCVFLCPPRALWLFSAAWPFVGASCSSPPSPGFFSRVSSPCRLPPSVLLLLSRCFAPLGRWTPAPGSVFQGPLGVALRRLLLSRCAGLLCALRSCVAAWCVVLSGVRCAVSCCAVSRGVWCRFLL